MLKTVINKSNTSCAICRTTWRDENIKFFRVPKNDAKRLLWIECCGVDLKNTSKLCEKHFLQSDFINAPGDALAKKSRLMPNAVPKRSCVSNRSVPNLMKSSEVMPLGTKSDSTTQTDDEFSKEVTVLKNRIQMLEMKVSNLEKQTKEPDCINALKAIFTKSQIRKMRNPNKKHVHWSLEDISAAFSLYSIGARAYRHLYQKGFPYPCEDTLKKWKQKIKINSITTKR